jgi:hypothetical protein
MARLQAFVMAVTLLTAFSVLNFVLLNTGGQEGSIVQTPTLEKGGDDAYLDTVFSVYDDTNWDDNSTDLNSTDTEDSGDFGGNWENETSSEDIAIPLDKTLFINDDLTNLMRASLPLPNGNFKKPAYRRVGNAAKYFLEKFEAEGTTRVRPSIYSFELMEYGKSFYNFSFQNSEYTQRCTKASVTVFDGPAMIGTCASLITSDFVFAVTEYEKRIPNPRYCYDKYNDYFKAALESEDNSSLNQPLDILNLFLPQKNMLTITVQQLVPVLYPYGSSFPHVIKDVMPRVMLSLPYLNENPGAKLLLEWSKPVEIFLARLGVPSARVIWVAEQTGHYRSLYRPAHRTVYQATQEIAVPHCYPGPVSTGMYSSEIYHAIKEMLVQAPDFNDSDRNLVIYVSRDGGHNSKMRRIDNEFQLLNKVEKSLKKQSEAIQKLGYPAPEFLRFQGGSMTLRQAIQTFQRARVVFGPHGGGMYNLIFAGTGTHVIEISPDDYGKNEVARFSTVLGLNYHGFIKRGMKRTQSFGKVNTDWIANEVLHYYAPGLLEEAPKKPNIYRRFNKTVLTAYEAMI